MSHRIETPIDHRGIDACRTAQRLMKRTLGCVTVALLLLLGPVNPSMSNADSTPCNCESCHGDHHEGNPPGCNFCHGAPPATGSHLLHYSNLPPEQSLTYGDTTNYSTTGEYKFGCGNCHPLDRAKHRDGTVEVELYDALAPAGSLKAKNPTTAAYAAATQTCSDVYCHSGYTLTSSTVGDPLRYPANPVPPGYTLNGPFGSVPSQYWYIMDASCSNLTYAPYTVNYQRAYKTTPAWGSTGNITTCRECHGFPPTTYSPAVSAGVGDGHQWIDPDDFRNLHAWNMFGDPVACRTCHYSTVTQTAGYYFVGADEIQQDPVPLSSHVTHVNGVPDVAFDTVNPVIYNRTHFYSLAGAAYDPSTKTCSDVACHYDAAGPVPPRTSPRWQQSPRWGAPYRYADSTECDLCHRFDLEPTCTAAPTP